MESAEGPIDPGEYGSKDTPPVEDKPYKIIFEANGCLGTGKCSEVSENWEVSLDTGIATPRTYFIGEDDLKPEIDAADICPAKKGRGVIHVVDRRTDEEVAPDSNGDGTLSVDW